jgi:hypothetical protein
MRPTLPSYLVVAALAVLFAPTTVEAQLRRGRQNQATAAWAPVSVGVRFGYDQNSNGEVVGAHAHIPVLRSGRVELAPSADMTFVQGAKDYQYGLDVAVVSGGRAGGLYLGGGIGYRDTVATSGGSGARSTLFGYSVLAGGRTGTDSLFQILFELRWIFLQDTGTIRYRPVPITLGIAFPLWGRG